MSGDINYGGNRVTGTDEHVTDAELLGFDRSRLADGDRVDFEAQLAEFGDRYRDHLMIAEWISGWQSRLEDQHVTDEAYRSALREVAAHLRQGDFLPGRAYYTPYGDRP